MRLLTFVTGLMIVVSTSAFAADPAGNWCRNEGGSLVDVINITQTGEVFKINTREGWGKPLYADGVGTLAANRLSATLRRIIPSTLNNIHVYMTLSGDRLSYRSWNLDGSFRW